MNRRRFLKRAGLWIPSVIVFPAIVRSQLSDPAFVAGLTSPASAPACSTPTNGTYNEGFEGSPYEVTSPAWSATGSPDATYTPPGTPPTGACSHCLRLTPGGSVQYILSDSGSDQAGWGIRFRFYIAAHPGATTYCGLVCVASNAGSTTCALHLLDLGTSIRCYCTGSNYWTINATTWYQIDVHFAPNGGAGATKLDGANEKTFTTGPQPGRKFFVGAYLYKDTGWDVSMDIVQWTYSDAYLT